MKNKFVYLNTAGTGLIDPEGIRAAKDFLDRTSNNPSAAFMSWMAEELPILRRNAARLLDTAENQIAFVPNFSFALSAVLQGLTGKLKKVLLYDSDYPSLNMPFEVGNFKPYYVQSEDGFHISNEAIFQKIEKEKIEIVALSHVQYLTGFKLDIKAIGEYCHEKGIVFIVDGTQSMGATPVNFDNLPVDLLIGSSYKWLNGGYGSAILCIKDTFIEKYPPGIAGFGSMDRTDDEEWKYRPSNKSFEPGHLNAAPLLQLSKSIEHKLDTGLESIHTHNTALIQRLHNGILDLPFKIKGAKDFQNRLHILIFEAEKTVAEALQEKGFAITWRKNSIRVSPHFYNTAEEIDGFLSALEETGREW